MQNVLVLSYLSRKDYCHNNLCVGIVSLYKYNVYILFLYKMEIVEDELLEDDEEYEEED